MQRALVASPLLSRHLHARPLGSMATSPPGGGPPPRDYQQLYFNVRHKPLVVHDVTVKGDDRTRPGLFDKVLAPIFRASSLDELRVRCLEANAILNSYDIFDKVDILCDAGPASAPDSASVTVEVSEKNKLNIKGGAYVSQSGEGSAEFSAGLNNAFGFAEKLDVEVLQGHERSSTYGFAWAQPRVFNADVDVTTRAYQQVSCSKRLSSFDETARGVSVTAVGGGPATLEYQLVFREIADPTRLASKHIRHQLGHSLKSSVAYSYVADTRDSPTRPTRGALYRLRSELAGIGADPQMTRFFKQEVEAQMARSPVEGVTLAASAKLGALVPLGDAARKKGTCVADRFFLGGVGSLRGFDTHGVGPSDERRPPKDAEAAKAAGVLSRDALGGDIVGSLFVSAQLEPTWRKLRDVGAYAHAFVNAGTLVPSPLGEAGRAGGAPADLKSLADSVRVSLGVGLVFPLPVGNIEVNYVKTARRDRLDRTKEGLQVGLATALAF